MYTIAIHGGAGAVTRQTISAEEDPKFRAGLKAALHAASGILKNNGTAVDAVEAAVKCLEDNPLFNAGKGAVYTKKGLHELDSSIMEGKHLNGVRNVRNPVSLARIVMEKSGHVLLSGKGANDYALKMKVEMESDDYFYTKQRYDQWLQVRHTDFYHLDHIVDEIPERKFGTVGCVVMDNEGNLAAATSTGGMINKQFGRIGDSPLIGAGTYANNNTCAISCTGHGELFIRSVAAYDVSCLMEYKNLSLQEAMQIVVNEKKEQSRIKKENGKIRREILSICRTLKDPKFFSENILI